MADRYAPKPSDKFTFGLWTTANPGRDPFGEPTRPPLDPIKNIRKMAEAGAWGFNFHDNDLIPFGATPQEHARIVRAAKKAMSDTGIVCSMATTNLFSLPVFKDGAFTSNDAKVRAFAIQKTMKAIDLGVDLGAKIYVFWGGREGAEVDASKCACEAIKRNREAMNFLTYYVKDQGYDLKFALEAKPNEPRGDIYNATTGNMLAFIETLDHKEMVGVNPEYAHETMAGLNFTHHVAQAIECGKLFHIDLNGQKMGRFDQDLRFGSEDIKGTFMLVRLLENSGYAGPRHFDAHAYRTEDSNGVWDFARGCMRTYSILKEKVAKLNADKEAQEIVKLVHRHDKALEKLTAQYSTENAKMLREAKLDAAALAKKSLPYERLDQIVVEVLMGVR
ncbi:MAG TPA: xylose isomerase [Planctomycetota bacterium]|nr:xylose isomerase [Planctomycetota bacterium]